MRVFALIFMLVVVFISSGCRENSGKDTEDMLTGYLIDSPVGGVRYSSQTYSGITGDDGSFQYRRGETVTFLLGDLLLGKSKGQEQINLFDLVEHATPYTGNALDYNALHDEGYNYVINLAVLLQTFDYDGDPANGIKITEDVAGLFEGAAISFDLPYAEFQNSVPFRRLLTYANEQSLLSDRRQVRQPWLAMGHLYVSLGMEGPYTQTQKIIDYDNNISTENNIVSYSYNTDGLLEKIVGNGNDVQTYIYDGDHNLLKYEVDHDDDGVAEWTERYEYDLDGNLIGKSYGFGSEDTRVVYTYNAIGQLTYQSRIDVDTESQSEIEMFAYDSAGNLIREGKDNDGDGIFDIISTYAYHANGICVLKEHDENGDGVVDWKINYDDRGNLVLRTNYNDDGTVRTQTHYEYDANNNLLGRKVDFNGDGVIDGLVTYAYDDRDNRIYKENDSNNDGVVDSIESYAYDANNNITLETFDYNGDGNAEKINTYAYDAENHRIYEAYDYDGDGSPEKITQYIFDSRGNLLQERFDGDGDGIVEQSNLYIYIFDDKGNVTQKLYDYHSDDDIDRIEFYAYDIHGNVIRQGNDNNGDNIVDYLIAYTYDSVGAWFALFSKYY